MTTPAPPDCERLYRALLDGAAVGVTVRSLDAPAAFDCNGAALRMYRASSSAELEGATLVDLSPARQRDGTPSAVAMTHHVTGPSSWPTCASRSSI
jgi:hypothetical protein